LVLIFVAWAAFLLPTIASFISDTICCWFLRHAQFFQTYLMAAYTAGVIGVIIAVCEFLAYLINLIF
jgi:hypothetical protein